MNRLTLLAGATSTVANEEGCDQTDRAHDGDCAERSRTPMADAAASGTPVRMAAVVCVFMMVTSSTAANVMIAKPSKASRSATDTVIHLAGHRIQDAHGDAARHHHQTGHQCINAKIILQICPSRTGTAGAW